MPLRSNTISGPWRSTARMMFKARLQLTRAVELDARYAEAWNDLGVIQRQQGKLKTSIECFHKAIDAKPRFESARYNLALAFEASHDFDAALKQARNVIALAPRIPQAHALCGRLLMEQNRLEPARDELMN
jgi:tetratricopeptide (TPR) repeat protein